MRGTWRLAGPSPARRWTRADLVADRDVDGAGEREQLEPGERVFGGARCADPPVGQIPEGSQRRRGVTRLGCPDGGRSQRKLGRREMPMTARSRSALRSKDTLFLEVADHSG